jgi:hypothetical protein
MAGFLDYLNNTMTSPLFLGGAALATGEGMDGAFKGFQAGGQMQDQARKRQQQQQVQQTLANAQNDPNFAGVNQGMLQLAQASGDVSPVVQALAKAAQEKRDSEMHPYNMDLKAAQADKARRDAAMTPGKFGKQGAMLQDPATGAFFTVQFAEDGTRKIEPVVIGGDGAQVALQPSRGVYSADTGTGTQAVDRATGRPVGPVLPKQIADKAAQHEIGQGQGKATVNLPGVEAAANRIVAQIDGVMQDKNLDNVTGWQAYTPTLRSSSVDTEEKIKQLSGGVFLQAFQDLKGGGAITEAEGAKATAALARLQNFKQSDAGFKQALSDARREIRGLVDLARARTGDYSERVQKPNRDRLRSQYGLE